MSQYHDITGQVFGKLTAIKQVENNNRGKKQWLFKCDCGNDHVTVLSNVKSGNTNSCGCLSSRLETKHGMWGTRLYNIYNHMLDRCCRVNSDSYHRYGARGITICEEWLNDRSLFFKWSLDHGYTEKLTIDRIDNNKGYSPDNCRWVTRITQQNNRANTIFITIKDQTKPLADWARELGIKASVIRSRLKLGWSPYDALDLAASYFDKK